MMDDFVWQKLDDCPIDIRRNHFVNFVKTMIEEGNQSESDLMQNVIVNEVLFPIGTKVKPRDLKMVELNGYYSFIITYYSLLFNQNFYSILFYYICSFYLGVEGKVVSYSNEGRVAIQFPQPYNIKAIKAINLDTVVDEKQSGDTHACGMCAANATFMCSRCKLMYYCSSEHQKEDWKNHKLVCGSPKGLKDFDFYIMLLSLFLLSLFFLWYLLFIINEN